LKRKTQRPEPMRDKALLSVLFVALLIISALIPPAAAQQQVRVWGEAVVPALAVAQLPNGTMIGSVGEIRVRVLYPGEGKVYVSTEPLSDIDMQASVRAAVMIASYYARVNPLDYDFLVSIIADSPLVGGPSAGSAITAAVYSALTHKQLNASVVSTGMILPDGLIGPVGGIPYKVQAAISKGYTTVLIPVGQSMYSETKYQTETVGSVIVTRPVTVTWNVTDMALKLGGRVVEASTAVDVLREFTGAYPLKLTYGSPSLSDEELELTRREYSFYLDQSAQIRSDVQSRLASVSSRTIRSTIQSWIQSSADFYIRAIDNWRGGYYYAGLSFAFVSAYQAMMAKYLLEASLTANPAGYLSGIYDNLTATLNSYKARYNGLINTKTGFSLDNLFLLAEIHSRIRDAENVLSSANQAIGNGDIVDASANLGYAWGRLRSLEYWIGLLNQTFSGMITSSQVERLASWILSYSYSSVSYVDALQSSIGASAVDTSSFYQMLGLASSLLAAGDYPGALDLSMDVLVRSSIALQSLFSLNITKTVNILSEHSRLILGNSESPPISARMYLMMADSFASQSDYESSLSYYERALIILYASTMTIARQEETTTINTQLGSTSTAQTQQGTTTTTTQATTSQQTQTSTETTAQQNATSTPTTTQPAFTSTTSLIALTAIVVVALILLANTLRRTNE
ncbi:MAG: hypothetical protein LM585_03420, partial [Fervidicoccaceae archaeon]|nr:hypothetical protein [Fervidicoccaceae archaeon]